jgi:hypothetical protein
LLEAPHGAPEPLTVGSDAILNHVPQVIDAKEVDAPSAVVQQRHQRESGKRSRDPLEHTAVAYHHSQTECHGLLGDKQLIEGELRSAIVCRCVSSRGKTAHEDLQGGPVCAGVLEPAPCPVYIDRKLIRASMIGAMNNHIHFFVSQRRDQRFTKSGVIHYIAVLDG